VDRLENEHAEQSHGLSDYRHPRQQVPYRRGTNCAVSLENRCQTFYVVSNGNTGTSYKATVTYSGSGPDVSSGCVAVEYSGTDPNYPLDSVSAAYSYSAGSLFDSGTAAPANANLLVFGGGTTDTGGAFAGSGFMQVQRSTDGNSVTEEYINPTSSPNNTLQRATAKTALPATGNWLMQMAIFRDASWTVTGGWNPARPAQIQFANQFSGTDACARAQTAANTTINGVPTMVVDSRGEILNGIPCTTPPPQFATGGEWLLPAGQFQITTPLIALGKTQHRGVCISYDVAHCSGFQSAWASGTGGLGGIPFGGTLGPWSSGNNYFSGSTATNAGQTWYSVINGNVGNTPGPGSGNWWSLASNYPSPVAEINMLTDANLDVESIGFHDLSFNCQYAGGASNVPTLGCAGFINTWGQEQTEMDQIRIENPTVAGIWLNSQLVANSGPYGPGTVGYGSTTQHNNAACRVNGSDASLDTATISSTAVTTVSGPGNTVMTVTLLARVVSGPWAGQVLDVVNGGAGLANIANGLTEEPATGTTHSFWMVWSVTDPTHFTVQAPSGQAPCLSSCGTANFFPIGINVTYDSLTTRVDANRGMYGWTINSSTCTDLMQYSDFPPLGFQFAMEDTPFRDSHVEGRRVGGCIGCFGPSQGEHLSNLILTTNMYTGVLIDNKFPVTGADVKDLNCASTTGVPSTRMLPDHYCLIDLINGNLLGGPGGSNKNDYVKHYWLDQNGNAYYEGGDCSEMKQGMCLTNGIWMNMGPKFTTNSGCSESALTGGSVAGQFTLPTPASPCTTVITMGNGTATPTAPHAWACWANDLNNASVAVRQLGTSSPTTTAKLSLSGASGDVIAFGCEAY
jgi:hypothetical protein